MARGSARARISVARLEHRSGMPRHHVGPSVIWLSGIRVRPTALAPKGRSLQIVGKRQMSRPLLSFMINSASMSERNEQMTTTLTAVAAHEHTLELRRAAQLASAGLAGAADAKTSALTRSREQ